MATPSFDHDAILRAIRAGLDAGARPSYKTIAAQFGCSSALVSVVAKRAGIPPQYNRVNPMSQTERSRLWRLANPEKARRAGRESAARRRAADPEKSRAYQRAQYRKDPDRACAYQKEYRRRTRCETYVYAIRLGSILKIGYSTHRIGYQLSSVAKRARAKFDVDLTPTLTWSAPGDRIVEGSLHAYASRVWSPINRESRDHHMPEWFDVGSVPDEEIARHLTYRYESEGYSISNQEEA